MEPDGFHSRSQRFSYLVACENARRIRDDPAILEAGKAHLDRFSRPDPHQRDGYALWLRLLEDGQQAVAAALMDRSAWGDWVRETAPSFGGLPARTRTRLLRLSTVPLATDADAGTAKAGM